MDTIKKNKILTASWILYILLCLYLILFAFRKEYDNNYGGAMYFMMIGGIYVVFLFIFFIGLMFAAVFNKEKRLFYLLNVPFLFIPILIEILIESIK